MGNMLKSRLSRFKQSHLVEHFVAGTTARTAASLCGVNRKTAALYFLRLREIIAYQLEVLSCCSPSWGHETGISGPLDLSMAAWTLTVSPEDF